MIRKFLALSTMERSLLLQAFALLPVASLLLRCLRFSRLQSLMGSAVRNLEVRPELIPLAHRMVEAASHIGFHRYTCLEKAIVLRRLLLRNGIAADLKFGVRKTRHFEAHAWLEVQGAPVFIDGARPQEYTVFTALEHYGQHG